jgi:hypothetical protein
MSQSTKSSQIQEELDYRLAIAGCYLDLAESCILGHANDDAIACIGHAAQLLIAQNRDLASLRIESSLRAIANSLHTDNEKTQDEALYTSRKPVCLHVLNEALVFGGHTAMATRWVQLDKEDRIHSVALLSHQLEPPAELVKAVHESGGTVYIADQKASIIQRAAWLRSLARDIASHVILHIDNTDLIAAVSFGKEGGPPVLLVNHAAHLFWVNVSAPDIIVNCRGSLLEKHWTDFHRGANNSATVPIPLPEPEPLILSETERGERKSKAREIIGVPKEAILILTVGASYKYMPFGEMDFLKTCQEILEAVPEAYLLAAGVIEDDRWRSVSSKVGFRLQALGSLPQDDIPLLHQASDIYIEGFPFGSTTALLEAGLKGLPVVVSPAECPPPYGTDGIALDDTIKRPASIEQYKSDVIRLCGNAAERALTGANLRESILANHTGAGWKRHLANALQASPPEHRAYPARAPQRTSPAVYEYWSGFQEILYGTSETTETILEAWIEHALSIGSRPKITPELKLACRKARSLRSGASVPVWILSFLCNYCFHLLPLDLAGLVFRLVKFVFRGGLLGRMRSKLLRMLGGTGISQAPHNQYRHIPERSIRVNGVGGLSYKKHLNQES